MKLTLQSIATLLFCVPALVAGTAVPTAGELYVSIFEARMSHRYLEY